MTCCNGELKNCKLLTKRIYRADANLLTMKIEEKIFFFKKAIFLAHFDGFCRVSCILKIEKALFSVV